MRHYQLKEPARRRIQDGYDLLGRLDLLEEPSLASLPEGELVCLEDQDQNFVAYALIGQQNKGIGWVLTRDPEPFAFSAYLRDRLTQAVAKRQELFASEASTAYRLFNGEGDGVGGMTVDWYQGYVQINWYTQGLHGYRVLIQEILQDLLPDLQGIYETTRFHFQGQEAQEATRLTYGQAAPSPHLVQENGRTYAVHLGSEWMTGIFLDQREVRDFVQSQSQDLEVLNLFSYTGAFSVAAALGGAGQTISVDVANRSLEKTEEQFQVNDLSLDPDQNRIRVMDVFDYLDYADRHDLTFDFIICDPPSFARTKDFTFAADQDYPALAQRLFDLTAPGGLCLLSTNHSGYRQEDFQADLLAVGQDHPGHFQMIGSYGLPADFPTTKDPTSQYLKVLVFYRTQA